MPDDSTDGPARPPSADDAELGRLLAERAGRLRAGYPAGLEHDLDEQWRQVRGRVHDGEEATARLALDRLAASHLSMPIVETTSSFPGGSAVHKLVTKTVERHLVDLVGQLESQAQLTRQAVGSLLAAFEDNRDEMRAQVAALSGELAELRRILNSRDSNSGAGPQE